MAKTTRSIRSYTRDATWYWHGSIKRVEPLASRAQAFWLNRTNIPSPQRLILTTLVLLQPLQHWKQHDTEQTRTHTYEHELEGYDIIDTKNKRTTLLHHAEGDERRESRTEGSIGFFNRHLLETVALERETERAPYTIHIGVLEGKCNARRWNEWANNQTKRGLEYLLATFKEEGKREWYEMPRVRDMERERERAVSQQCSCSVDACVI